MGKYKDEISLENVYDLIIESQFTDEEGDKYRLDEHGDKDWISKFEQYRMLQHFGFNLQDNEIYISKELADFLTERYFDLQNQAEQEMDIDFSGDYIMNFNRWVKGIESPVYW